jgi:hypothetical protein
MSNFSRRYIFYNLQKLDILFVYHLSISAMSTERNEEKRVKV